MSLERHVANISWAAYYHLHSIGHIRRYLSHEHTKQLVHAQAISHIDCCNSFLNGLSTTLIETSASTKCLCTCYNDSLKTRPCHALASSKMPHHFQDSTSHFQMPSRTQYLSALLSSYCLTRSLSSADKLLLKQPTSHTKIGERVFSWSAPMAWNELSITMQQCTSVGQFKMALKRTLKKIILGLIN